jgi:phosphoribosylcarboxyaminoimidazole (NCAIR) mutase
MAKPLVGIIMGSDSDLDVMSEAAKVLDEFKCLMKYGLFLRIGLRKK